MVNVGLGIGNSQFFILFEDVDWLDGKYVVFGKVIEGMKYVDDIKKGISQDGCIFDGELDVIIIMWVVVDVEGGQ